MRGRFQEAREFSGRTQALLEDIGALAWLANARVHAAQVELLAGDPEAAERELRWAHETLQRMGDEVNAATVRALLAEALEDQDREAEAERWTEVGDETVLENEVLARVMCGAARAKAVARAGRFHEAERLAQDAVAVAGETDALNLRAHASLALADVLRRTRAGAEATSAAAEAALALYRAKGNLIGYARAEQLLAELRAETGPVTAPESPSDPPSLDRPGG